MEELAAQERALSVRRRRAPTSVQGIACQRVSQRGEVDPYLVSAARFGEDFYVRIFFWVKGKVFQHLVLRRRLAAARDHGHALAVPEVPSDGSLDDSLGRLYPAPQQSQVALTYDPGFDLGGQVGDGRGCPSPPSLDLRCLYPALWTIPGRITPPMPVRSGQRASSAFTRVWAGCPGAGCTVRPAGLSMTSISAS